MKITIIGSSHGVPEANRRCSSTMIEVGERIYFVDMGTMVIDELRRRGRRVEDVHGIFLTHMHGDHTNGLLQFIDLINWYFRDANPVICLPDMRAADVLESWLRMTTIGKLREYRYTPVEAGVVFDDGVLRVTAIRTKHLAVSYAYLLEAEGKRVVITGDLKNPGEDFPVDALSAPIDLVICECAHFSALDYLPIYEKPEIRKICVTHYSDLHVETILELRRRMKAISKPLLLATDGLEILV